MPYTLQDFSDELGREFSEFFTELGNFSDLTNLQKVDYVDLFASQKFTLISEIAGELPNGEALLKGLARGFFAASL